jgi:hypothetical protein|mmetsp:Transcript_13640/g.21300  ORF Transcript_13640/g.21300 Transcript_13640/m.21300 type:complete len:105 (-) Transcript_13640:613-927(-)
MTYAVLSFITKQDLHVGEFTVNGPKDLKERIDTALQHTYNTSGNWDGDIKRSIGGFSFKVYKLLNCVEASGWDVHNMSVAPVEIAKSSSLYHSHTYLLRKRKKE